MPVQDAQKRFTSREQFTKAVRAKAHKDNVRFQEALGEFDVPHRNRPQVWTCSCCVGYTSRQVPNYSLRPQHLFEDTEEPTFDDIYNVQVDFYDSPADLFKRTTDMSVSLLDIARPAKKTRKAKGKAVAKDEFQVVSSKALHAPAIPEEEFEIWEDDVYDRSMWEQEEDEWEQIFDEHNADTRPSYAAILQRNDG
ncbi:hypothetical protein D9619_006283 [Psilocybe cf. subviscida]|uniref:Uncharacterized protein n=1 Tax=Psilocybe cf. subviscida TaxID=2480587 RepID=A0A8H5B4T9_9AGAR|nr:hypothetical protein D9619_006283 [Psilocybe cf. subviscida]